MNKTLNQLRDEACHNATKKGFYDVILNQLDFGQEEEGQELRRNLIHSITVEQIAYIHSELSEAVQAARGNRECELDFFKASMHVTPGSNPEETNNLWKKRFEEYIKGTFEDELADALIRILSLCGLLDIDIEKHVELKMKYNETRERKHGKKY